MLSSSRVRSLPGFDPERRRLLVRAEDVVKSVAIPGQAAHPILKGVNASIRRGEFVAIMGPSGAGKSTLLHILGGLEKPTSGRVTFDGVDLAALSDNDLTVLRRKRIGLVFQSFNLVPLLTVRENILLPRLLDGKAQAADGPMLDILTRLLGLTGVLGLYPGQLSPGEQQRIAIARALLGEPDLVLADEPTGALDHQAGIEVLEELWSGCVNLGRTVVMVTHEAKAANYADRVLVIRDGVIHDEVELGRDHIRTDARTLVTRLQASGL